MQWRYYQLGKGAGGGGEEEWSAATVPEMFREMHPALLAGNCFQVRKRFPTLETCAELFSPSNRASYARGPDSVLSYALLQFTSPMAITLSSAVAAPSITHWGWGVGGELGFTSERSIRY